MATKNLTVAKITGHIRHTTKERPYGYRILRTILSNGREWQYHATKGWRSRRAAK